MGKTESVIGRASMDHWGKVWGSMNLKKEH